MDTEDTEQSLDESKKKKKKKKSKTEDDDEEEENIDKEPVKPIEHVRMFFYRIRSLDFVAHVPLYLNPSAPKDVYIRPK